MSQQVDYLGGPELQQVVAQDPEVAEVLPDCAPAVGY